jgi:hypothetical protein
VVVIVVLSARFVSGTSTRCVAGLTQISGPAGSPLVPGAGWPTISPSDAPGPLVTAAAVLTALGGVAMPSRSPGMSTRSIGRP